MKTLSNGNEMEETPFAETLGQRKCREGKLRHILLCFEPDRMLGFPPLARVIGCSSDCKLNESRNHVLCISV